MACAPKFLGIFWALSRLIGHKVVRKVAPQAIGRAVSVGAGVLMSKETNARGINPRRLQQCIEHNCHLSPSHEVGFTARVFLVYEDGPRVRADCRYCPAYTSAKALGYTNDGDQ